MNIANNIIAILSSKGMRSALLLSLLAFAAYESSAVVKITRTTSNNKQNTETVQKKKPVAKKAPSTNYVPKKKTSSPSAPSAPAAPRPAAPSYSSDVMMHFEPGEAIYENEYMSSWSANKRDFVLVTHNEHTGRYSLVHNGQRMLTAVRPFEILYINPADISDAAVVYSSTDGTNHIYLNGKDYGGVSEIYNVWIGPSTCKIAAKINGQNKLIDVDGSSQSMRNYSNIGEGPLVFHSPNGKNFVSFTNKANTVVHNGKRIDIRDYPDGITPEQAYIDKVVITDNNQLMVEGTFGSEKGIFVNSRGMVSPYNPNQHTPSFADDRLISINTDSRDEDDYHFGNQLDCAWNYDITDNSGYHTFSSSWDEDYVTIDGRQLGNYCAVYAFYDQNKHAFSWVCIEDDRLVMHTYRL